MDVHQLLDYADQLEKDGLYAEANAAVRQAGNLLQSQVADSPEFYEAVNKAMEAHEALGEAPNPTQDEVKDDVVGLAVNQHPMFSAELPHSKMFNQHLQGLPDSLASI